MPRPAASQIDFVERLNIYIALEDFNFIWDERAVVKIDEMWNKGYSIFYIAKEFDRDPDEVAILIIDRVRNGFIAKR